MPKKPTTDGIRSKKSGRRAVLAEAEEPKIVLKEQEEKKPAPHPSLPPEGEGARVKVFPPLGAEKRKEGGFGGDAEAADREPSGEILIAEPAPQVKVEDFFRKGAEERVTWIPAVSAAPSSRRWFIWGGGAGFIFLLAAALLLSTVFARANISVKPRVENIDLRDISVGFDISVSKTLLDARVLPAELLTFSRKEAGEFEATGKEFVAEKARGRVRIYNSFSSSPQSLVANTRFLTNDGILYRLPRPITIPGAKIEEGKIVPQFIEAELIADKPGQGSNLSGEIRLSIPGFQGSPKYDGFYAIAPEGFSGGFEGEARVVSAEDKKRAEEAVTKKVYDGISEEMSRKTPPEFTFVEKLREIEITNIVSPKSGTRRDKFVVEAEAKGRAFFFRQSDLISLLQEMILKDGRSKELMPDTANFSYRPVSLDYEKGKAAVVVNGTIKLKYVIPEKELALLVKGKKRGSIIEALKSREELAQFSVSIFPPWRASAPNDESKIRILTENP